MKSFMMIKLQIVFIIKVDTHSAPLYPSQQTNILFGVRNQLYNSNQ